MATFKIHEDTPIEMNSEAEDKENETRIPMKKEANEKRIALKSFDNGIRQEPRRKEKLLEQIKQKRNEGNIELDPAKIAPTRRSVDEDLSFSMSRDLSFPKVYNEDIWNYYKEIECSALPKPNYMVYQPEINWKMRSIVVDWLIEVADEYQMSQDSLHLAVNYIDRFLSKITVAQEKLQLVGATAMLIAGKMEEIHPPMPKEWAYLSSDLYTVRQILRMEQLFLQKLEFRLQPPTSYSFLRRFCAENDIDDKTTNLAQYLSELILLEGEFYLNYKPSEIAAAVVLFARRYLMKSDIWTQKMEQLSGYNIEHLSPIVEAQNSTMKNTINSRLKAIQQKYKSPKFGMVALLEPKSIEFDDLPKEENEETSEKISN